MFLLLLSCSGPATDDITSDTVSTAETGVTETADTQTVATGDTGPTLPEGLVGEPFDLPMAPMSFFVAEDLDSVGRGPSHLYNGTPTLLVFLVGINDSESNRLADDFHASLTTFEAAEMNLVVVTRSVVGSNVSFASGWPGLDVWSDPDAELEFYYDNSNRPESFLIDAEGYAILGYDRPMILGSDNHADDVIADAVLLWGSR